MSIDPNALASALPAGISYDIRGDVLTLREIAEFQAERLAESGYVLLHPDLIDEATVDRLAAAGARGEGMDWERTMDGGKEYFRANTRAVLAALAAAPDPDGGKDEGVSG